MQSLFPRLSPSRLALLGLLATGAAAMAASGAAWLGAPTGGPEPGTLRLQLRLGADLADVYLPAAPQAHTTSKPAPHRPQPPWPVALLLPGAQVDKEHYATFAALLAREGFVVVVPNHWRTFPPLPLIGRRLLLADQRQIPALLAALPGLNTSAPPPARGAMDSEKLVVVGHSMGGLAGIEALANRCRFPLCVGTFTRPRQLRGGAFVGTDLRGHGGGAVAPIDTDGLPVALIRGSRDGASAAADVEATWRQLRTHRRAFLTIKGANHYAITNSSQPVNPPNLPPIRPDPNPATANQRQTLERIARWIGAFLRQAVETGQEKNNGSAAVERPRRENEGIHHEPARLDLLSDAFPPGGWIPQEHSGEGADLSPPLRWSGMPEGIGAFALILDDPDAPPGLWIHWVLYNLPPEQRHLPAGLPADERLAIGALQGVCWGVESFERLGYAGPLPPPGRAHHYRFHLYALDAPLALPPGATARQVRAAAAGHTLAEAHLIGRYQRRG